MTPTSAPATGPWRRVPPREARVVLGAVRSRWWIAGGWALDLFIGRQCREHRDLDVGILRRDAAQVIAVLTELEFFAARDGVLTGPLRGAPRPEVNSLWGRPAAGGEWLLELMLDESDGAQWVFRRARSIRRPFARAVRHDPGGTPYLAPEIQLLYKANRVRAEDAADFERTAPLLQQEPRAWLERALAVIDAQHPWLARLRERP